MNLKSYFDAALDQNEFELLLDGKKGIHEHHYNRFNPDQEWISVIRSLDESRVIVITEPWCGDSLALLPVLFKMGEINGKWMIRVLLRSEHEDLMDKFLTHGGRAIPIFLFLNRDHSLNFRWGPRPPGAQYLFESYREKINSGEVDKKDVHIRLRKFYAADRGNEVMHTIIETLENKKNKMEVIK